MTVVPTCLFEQGFWLEANFLYYAKPKAPRIPASSGVGIVSIPTKWELDQMGKDTNPKAWWIREKILFCVQWGSTILSSCCGLIKPMWKPEGGNILSPRELTSHQIRLKWPHIRMMWIKPGWSQSVWYHCSCRDWALQSLFGCLIFPRCSTAQCHGHPNKKGVDDLYPPQLPHLFSLLLNDKHPLSRCCCHGSPRGWCTAHPLWALGSSAAGSQRFF